MMKNRVVITGIGVISAMGNTTDEFWGSCLQMKDYIVPIPEEWNKYSSFSSRYWSPLDKYSPSSSWLSKADHLQLDLCQQMVLDAAFQAVSLSGIGHTEIDPKKKIMRLDGVDPRRSGVFIGTGAGGITSLLTAHSTHISPMQKNLFAPVKYNPFTVPMMMINGSADILGIRFSIHGINRTVSTACASGTMAIGEAFRAISEGTIDFALAGGVEYLHDPTGGIFRGFDSAGTLTRNTAVESCNCPFDQNRSGFLFSEGGCAMFVIESLEQAELRGSVPLAEIKAYKEKFEAYNLMMMEPDGKQIESLLRSVVAQASLDLHQIDYINAHGTGTVLNDQIEADVIERVFGSDVLVNSTKSLTGHVLGASGALEAAVTVLSVCHNKIHGSKNIKTQVKSLNFTRETISHPVKNALTESFGFGGHLAALVIGKV
jgi:3-oxoacyl-[acyl-carrier-protein] synthase II